MVSGFHRPTVACDQTRNFVLELTGKGRYTGHRQPLQTRLQVRIRRKAVLLRKRSHLIVDA